MNMKRLLTLILALLTLLSTVALVACKGDDPEAGTGEGETLEPIVDDGYEENEKLTFDPSEVDYQKTSVKILQRDIWATEMDPDENSTNRVDQVKYERNYAVEEQLNLTVEFLTVPGQDGVASVIDTQYLPALNTIAMSGGDEVDFTLISTASALTKAVDGYWANLNEIPEFDFTKAWWNQSFVTSASMNNKLYSVIGDVTTSVVDLTEVVYFNKEMVENHFPEEDLYQVALDGNWTYAQFLTYIKDVGDQDDFATLILADNSNSTDGLVAGVGITICTTDANGVPSISMESEINKNWVEKLRNFVHETPGVYQTGAIDTVKKYSYWTSFAEGKAMFEIFRLMYTRQDLADSTVEYGILPMPKADEYQDAYQSMPQNTYSSIAIFNNIKTERKSMCANVLELMGYYSYHDLRPELYEVMYKQRYLDDPQSSQIFDIVIDCMVFDFGYIWSEHLGDPIVIYRNIIWKNQEIASTIEPKATAAQTKLEQLIDFFNE